MATITDPLPDDVRDQVAALDAALDAVVPAKRLDRNLLLATWNLRAFGDLVEEWHSEGHRRTRDLSALACITRVLARFDVVALQEVRGNLKCLRHALKRLGPDWGLILTDVTAGRAGNDERLAFVFDTRRVRPSGLACELVLPTETPGAVPEQFARTPYAVSFVSAGETFILTTLHVRWGEGPAERVPELRKIADWLASWARHEDDWGHNLLALGDFNIDRRDDPLYQAFTSTGLRPPDQLQDVPRTIFDRPGHQHFYDQIAWFTGDGGVPVLDLRYSGRAGYVDFVPVLRGTATLNQLSWRISDHYPLWAEFEVPSRPG